MGAHAERNDRITKNAVGHMYPLTIGGRTAVVLNCLTTDDAAGTRIETHRHVHCEAGIVIAGAVEYVFGKKRYVLRAGEAILIPPHTPHVRICRQKSRIFGFWLFLTGMDRMHAVHIARSSAVTREYASIVRETDHALPGCEQVVAGHLTIIIVMLLRALRQHRNEHEDMRGLSRVSGAIRYINDNIAGELSSANIAHASGISPRHINRLFRQATGATLHDFVHETKMLTAAIELVRRKYTPVREIARLVGMHDLSYFAKCMRSFTGRTPSELRGEE